MSGSMYAGRLCATQVGGRIEVDDCDLTPASPWVLEVRHNHNHKTILVHVKHGLTHVTQHRLAADHVVRVEDPS